MEVGRLSIIAKVPTRRDAAKARMAATARRPDQRWTQPAQAAARGVVGGWPHGAGQGGEGRRQLQHQSARRPRPITTRRARRALASSGYVWRRLRRAAASTAALRRVAAPGCGSRFRVTGLTRVASSATFRLFVMVCRDSSFRQHRCKQKSSQHPAPNKFAHLLGDLSVRMKSPAQTFARSDLPC